MPAALERTFTKDGLTTVTSDASTATWLLSQGWVESGTGTVYTPPTTPQQLDDRVSSLEVSDKEAATGSIRTLGSGAQQAAPGNHGHPNGPYATVSGMWRLADSSNNRFTLNSNSWFQYHQAFGAIHFRFRLVLAGTHIGHVGFKIETDITAQNPNDTDGPAGWCAFGRSAGGSRMLWLDIPDNDDFLYLYDPNTGGNFGYDLAPGDYFYGQGFYTIA